jgi:hypothetical protein
LAGARWNARLHRGYGDGIDGGKGGVQGIGEGGWQEDIGVRPVFGEGAAAHRQWEYLRCGAGREAAIPRQASLWFTGGCGGKWTAQM